MLINFLQSINYLFRWIFDKIIFCRNVFLLAGTLFSLTNIFPQWSSNPSLNTSLVLDADNPVNISSVNSSDGSIFVFWQDSKNGNSSNIFFQLVDVTGKIGFGAEGKSIGISNYKKENPIAAASIMNSAVVVWMESSGSKKNKIVAQRISSKGFLFWGDNGIEITSEDKEIVSYALTTDKDGFSYITYIEKSESTPADYKIKIQKISLLGHSEFRDDGLVVTSSNSTKNFINVLSDDKGGAFIFWLENENKINQVHGQYISSKGNPVWDKNNIDISGHKLNVVTYKTLKVNSNTFYVYWLNQGKEKYIYHQLFNNKGNVLWTNNERVNIKSKGSQLNPFAIASPDSTIILSWTQDYKKEKDIFIQKFNFNGNPLWNEGGKSFLKLKGEQFGQLIIPDKRGGVIAAWFDRRNFSVKPNIYCQRLNKKGELVWDSAGVLMANYINSEKSYLSLHPDNENGVIAIFKEIRKNNVGVFGQRVFANNTLISQITGFNAEVAGDSVKISWQTINENDFFRYRIERLISKSNYDTTWNEIYSLVSNAPSKKNYYSYVDQPIETGTIYYRVSQLDRSRNVQISEVVRVNFEGMNDDNFFVYQNVPNPFSDSTSIQYYLPIQVNVKFEFYNSRVEKINEFEIDNTKVGRNKITFFSAELPSGVYFYRFIADDFVEVKKMVVEK